MFTKNKSSFYASSFCDLPREVKTYIALAEPTYGGNIDPQRLQSNTFYEKKLSKPRGFYNYCGPNLFTDKQQAEKNASHRSVTRDSAYVISLDCSRDEVKDAATKGTLFNHILSIKNVNTGEEFKPISAGCSSHN